MYKFKIFKRFVSGDTLYIHCVYVCVYRNLFIISASQARGHLIADIDPLGIQNPESAKLQGTSNLPPAIVVREHLKGMTDADMDKEFPLASFTVIGGDKRSLPLREILSRLNKVYCGHLGLEYTYIHDLNVVRAHFFDKFSLPRRILSRKVVF